MDYKKKAACRILENKELSHGIWSMTVKAGSIAETAVPGQFCSLYCKDRARLLPRPISICDADAASGTVRFVYRVVGNGTEEFSKLEKEDCIYILGPLGNGYRTEDVNGHVLIFGGGVGIPPLLFLAKDLKKKGVKVTAVLGFRSKDTFLSDEFQKYADLIISTDDGSLGVKGTVLDAATVNESTLSDVSDIMACGPIPMLRGVKAYGKERDIRTQISMEERMACGIGVCLGCVIKTAENDEHSMVKNARVCKDGPVFPAELVDLD